MRITLEVVAERDSTAKAKNYIPVTPFQGVTVARRHSCMDCGHEGMLSPNKYWGVGRGCPKCGANRRGATRLLTQQQVDDRDGQAESSSYVPIGDFTGSDSKRLHKCSKCGFQGELTPSSYWNNGTGCPEYANSKRGDIRKLTDAEVAERDKKANHYETYPPIGAYKGGHSKRLHMCRLCKYEGTLVPQSFWRSGTGCPKCSRAAKAEGQTLHHDIVALKDSKAKHYLSFPPIDPYKAAKAHRKHICLKCHKETTMSPDQFWRGGGCSACTNQQRVAELIKRSSLSLEAVLDRDSNAEHFNVYPPAECEEYVNKNTSRIHECNTCGHIGELTPKEFWDDKRGCPKCNKRILSSEVVSKRDIASKHFNSFPPQSAFEGTNIHRLHVCTTCGHLGLLIPNLFWRGTGCTNCNFKIGQEEADRRDRKAAHTDTYSPIEGQKYEGIDTQRTHRCSEPNCNYTGELSPYNFWSRDVGCPKCAEKRIALAQVFTAEQVREKDCSSIYFDGYPPVGEYTNALTPRLHKCVIHGENWTAPCSFWASTGCPECGRKRSAEARVLTLDEVAFKDESSLHFDDYPPVGEYEGALIPRHHNCTKHGENRTSPSSFWSGTGCPGCAKTGFNTAKSGLLYYLRVEVSPSNYLYKIGITNRSVNERFTNSDLEKISILHLWRFDIGEYARQRETEVLRAFKEFKYKGEAILSSGNSELFIKDILDMDFENTSFLDTV